MDIVHDARREWVAGRMRERPGEAYFLAFLFKRLPGSTASVLGQMRPAAEALHAAVWAPRPLSDFQELGFQELRAANWLNAPAPRLFAAPARFVPRRVRKGIEDNDFNGGLHVRAVMLLPEQLRPAAALERRVREDPSIQRGARGKLRRVDVERVPPGAEARAAELLLEGLKREPAFKDELLILP